MKLTVSTDKEEILRVIQEAKSKGQNILWQTKADRRSIFEISDIDFDPIREVIRCKVDNPKDINDDLIVYIKLTHRNTIFKGSLQLRYSEYIYVQVPDEVRLEELREFRRFSFEPEEERKIKIAFESDFVDNAFVHEDVNLVDMSRTGLGILLDQSQKNIIDPNQIIKLSQLGNFEFKSAFELKPVWQVDYMYKTQSGFSEIRKKAGFKFVEPLPQKLITDFIKLEEGQYEYEIGFLGQSKKFKRKMKKEYKKMLERVKSKKRFFDFFKEAARAKDVGVNYLPRHIRTLSLVSCALARITQIADIDMIKQLTYASLVHDIAFFNNPKLAQIKSREHFEKVKQFLNVSEKELYYRSYHYALEYVYADKDAPAGAAFLLSELQDYHLAGDKEVYLKQKSLSEAAAVFIVAHHLTDYILSHPQWTFYEYLENYPFFLFGKNFEMIYLALNEARIAA